MASYIYTEQSITIVFDDGDNVTLYKSPNENQYDKVIDLLKDRSIDEVDWDAIQLIACPVKQVIELTKSQGSLVSIKDGIVLYDDIPMNNALTRRMLGMINDNMDISPLVKFMDNVMNNPSKQSTTELYTFLESSELPITPDGHFLAYKKVNNDYKDCHTNTIDNSPGQIVKMTRNEVDDDRNNTCSTGLHFCSKSYLSSFGGAHTMLLKINPADVVSIPTDYNNAKGRTCRYEVVKELDVDTISIGTDETIAEGRDLLNQLPEYENAIIQPILGRIDAISIHDKPDHSFASVDEASKVLQIPQAYIKRVLRGHRRSTGGYIFRTTGPDDRHLQT